MREARDTTAAHHGMQHWKVMEKAWHTGKDISRGRRAHVRTACLGEGRGVVGFEVKSHKSLMRW